MVTPVFKLIEQQEKTKVQESFLIREITIIF